MLCATTREPLKKRGGEKSGSPAGALLLKLRSTRSGRPPEENFLVVWVVVFLLSASLVVWSSRPYSLGGIASGEDCRTTLPWSLRSRGASSTRIHDQFRLRPILTSANFWMLNFGTWKKWSPEGWSAEGWSPEGWSPEGWRAQNFAFFSLLRHNFLSSFSLLGSPRGIWWCLKGYVLQRPILFGRILPWARSTGPEPQRPKDLKTKRPEDQP